MNITRVKMRRNRYESGQSTLLTRSCLLFVLTLSVGFVCASGPCYADVVVEKDRESVKTSDSSHNDINVSVGIAGVYKNGFQTPVVLSWNPDSDVASVELETIDSDGTPFLTRRDVSENEKKDGRAESRFVFPKANAKLTVRLIDTQGNSTERVFTPTDKRADSEQEGLGFKTPSPSSKPIFVVIGSSALGFSEAFAELRWKEERRPAIVSVSSFNELPTDFRSYEAIDRLFITTSDASVFEGITNDSPQIRAIEQWVRRGGGIVLLADEKAIPLLSEGGALANLSPGSKIDERPKEFRYVNSLVTELRNVKNLAMTGSKSNPYLRTPVLQELKNGAKIEMQEMETPLLVSFPLGLGSVIYFAGDLSVAPLANWSGRGRLILKILGMDADRTASKAPSSAYVKRGYLDLSGQTRSALDSFGGVKIVPFSIVAGLIFAYLLFIAPLDWFLSKKAFKKPNITWITFPIFAVLFSVVAVFVVKAATPKTPVLNQTDVVDVDMESGIVRDSSWLGFYSPASERYELSLTPNGSGAASNSFLSLDDNSKNVDLTPLSLAGDGIGGAEQKSYTTKIWNDAYCLQQNDSVSANLTAVPMTTRSSKSFYGRWTANLKDVPQTPKLTDDGLVLRGSVYNPFNVPIYSAFIIFQGGAYALGTLAPGETPLPRGMSRIEPMRVLNEHQSSIPTEKLGNWSVTSYNNSSTRLPYILRTASFYDFGGGEDNFGVLKRLQRDVDLSELLRCGRAVIFGTIVDAHSDEYQDNNALGRRSVNALQDEELSKKIAEQKGETFENAMEASVEKYGLTGTSDSFEPTKAEWRRNGKEEKGGANERTVVVRLVVPLTRGSE